MNEKDNNKNEYTSPDGQVKLTLNDPVFKNTQSETAPVSVEFGGYSLKLDDYVTFSGKTVTDGEKIATESGIKITDGDLSVGYTDGQSFSYTSNKGPELKDSDTISIKKGPVEFSSTMDNGIGYDSKKGGLTQNYGTKNYIKVGNETANAKVSGGRSYKSGPGGYTSQTDSVGVDGKLGPVEGGVEQSHTEAHSDDGTTKKETETDNTKIKGGVDLGGGVKVTHSIDIEKSHSVAENSDSITEEETTKQTHSTRIQVDSSKAGVVGTMAAAGFNTSMAATEKMASEATKTTNTHTVSKKNEAEESQGYSYDYGMGF